MSKRRIEEIVEEFAQPITDALNYELVDVEFIKEAGNWYLRIYIDKDGGITIDDCQAVSERISEILDEKDPIPDSYILEVSSPGLTRPLKKEKDFKRYIDNKVEINLFRELDGSKKFEGILKGIDEDRNVKLQVNDNLILIKKSLISLAKLKIEF